MKNILYLLKTLFFSVALILVSCEKENYEFGDIITPSNLQVTAQIVGKDATHPNGNGSGEVIFTATADNAITYKYIYEGTESMAPSGVKKFIFSKTGTFAHAVTVIASGTAGVTTSKTIEVVVRVDYTPPADLLAMLYGGGSRTWRVKAEGAGHYGVGPADALTPIWWSAGPNDKAGKGGYDDRIVFKSNKGVDYITGGGIFGKAAPLETDFGVPVGLTKNGDNEYENYPLGNFTDTWTLSAPGGKETLTFGGKGFHTFYVGGNHSYTILSRTANEMKLRTTGADGLGWFVILIAVD